MAARPGAQSARRGTRLKREGREGRARGRGGEGTGEGGGGGRGRKEGKGRHRHPYPPNPFKRKAFVSCCANSSLRGRREKRGGERGRPHFPRLPLTPPAAGLRSGAGPAALRAPAARRGCERCAPPCAGPLALLTLRTPPSPYTPTHPSNPPFPRSAAPLNPGSRPASRLALNNCLPPAKRPWGKYLLNGNNCPGSPGWWWWWWGTRRLFQAYWFSAPALVNKPAPKKPPPGRPYSRPSVY